MKNKSNDGIVRVFGLWGLVALFMIGVVGSNLGSPEISATELKNSEIDLAFHQLRYSANDKISDYRFDSQDEFSELLPEYFEESGLLGGKSLLKAGLLSLVVPGLGQFYNGSHPGKIALFAGAEIGLLVGAKKYDSDGNDIVKTFEKFADDNWNEQDYSDYLFQVYGDVTDAEDTIGFNHGHHLPSTQTQQYYEMIGKYDQFSYGWARTQDSTSSGVTLVWDTDSTRYNTDRVGPGHPYDSENRTAYNDMRGNANTAFGDRDRMVVFVIVNHVVSSIDAIVSAARHNKTLSGSDGGLSIHPSVGYDENWALVPKVKLSWSF